jgi:hypothetical protein
MSNPPSANPNPLPISASASTGDDTVERYLTRIAALTAAEEAAVDRARANRPAPDDHAYWFFEYANHAIEALHEWVFWHIKRAKVRSIPTEGGALDAVIDAAATLACALEDGAEDEIMDAHQEALHAAITRAKEAAEKDRFPRTAANLAERDHQAEELETSFLRGWARIVDDIEYCRRMARDSPERATQHQILAAHALAFFAPPPVRHFEK